MRKTQNNTSKNLQILAVKYSKASDANKIISFLESIGKNIHLSARDNKLYLEGSHGSFLLQPTSWFILEDGRCFVVDESYFNCGYIFLDEASLQEDVEVYEVKKKRNLSKTKNR